MLRACFWWLGRWSHRDFLRGRSKCAGSIHTRHTHGSKGRYKRHSALYSLRDGRRHACNHMKGALGIKLGGGLFGLRVPRQRLLSSMTREEYELEMYGHPNITNPYRKCIEEHPSLRLVMENATPVINMVLLMPRIARSAGDVLPPQWEAIGRELCELFSQRPALEAVCCNDGATLNRESPPDGHWRPTRGAVYFSTLDLSVSVSLAELQLEGLQEGMSRNLGEGSARHGPFWGALTALYREHRRGRKLSLVSTSRNGMEGASSGKYGTAGSPASFLQSKIPFLGPALRAAKQADDKGRQEQRRHQPCLSSTAFHYRKSPGESTRIPSAGTRASGSDLAQKMTEAGDAPEKVASGVTCSTNGGAFEAVHDGVGNLLRRLRGSAPNALCLCLRPSSFDSFFFPANTDPVAPGFSLAKTTTAVPLLKADRDPDEEVGVWRRQRRDGVGQLLRWHYASRDPRAHNNDAIPHRERYFPILLFLDTSKMRQTTPQTSAAGADTTDFRGGRLSARERVPSLLSRQQSEELMQMGFKALHSCGLRQVLEDMQQWSVGHQWWRSTVVSLRHCRT